MLKGEKPADHAGINGGGCFAPIKFPSSSFPASAILAKPGRSVAGAAYACLLFLALVYAEKVGSQLLSLRHILLKYKVNLCFSMVDSRIASGRGRVLEANVIRSEIRSRAELNCALPLFLHAPHQRDTAHRSVGTGRLRARHRFGYWGEQIGHLRDQSGHHFGTRRQNSSLQPRVGVETAMPNVESTGRPATNH